MYSYCVSLPRGIIVIYICIGCSNMMGILVKRRVSSLQRYLKLKFTPESSDKILFTSLQQSDLQGMYELSRYSTPVNTGN